jgi:hypothetical protein
MTFTGNVGEELVLARKTVFRALFRGAARRSANQATRSFL